MSQSDIELGREADPWKRLQTDSMASGESVEALIEDDVRELPRSKQLKIANRLDVTVSRDLTKRELTKLLVEMQVFRGSNASGGTWYIRVDGETHELEVFIGAAL